jgi:hypothetical protein
MTKRQNEMFAGVKPNFSTSTFTTSAPVPQRTPSPQAAKRAKLADDDSALDPEAWVNIAA